VAQRRQQEALERAANVAAKNALSADAMHAGVARCTAINAEDEADAEAEDSEPVQKGGYTEHGMTRAEGMQVRKGILRGYYRQISK
jgi:hypothetical protein